MVRIERIDDQGQHQSFDCDEDVIRIGRSADNEVVVDVSHVSSEHASITFCTEGYVLRDLGSTNGTRVRRGEALLSVGSEEHPHVALQSGDELLLGDPEQPVTLTLELRKDEGANIVSVRRADELRRLEAEASGNTELLRKLYEAQKAISAQTDLEALVDAVAEHVFRNVSRATHVTLVLREQAGDKEPESYVPIGTRVHDEAHEEVPVTRSVFRKVLEERAAVLAADAKREVGETASLMQAQILSTIGVPFWQGDSILGVLQVDNRGAQGMFRESDLDLVAVLAQSSSQAFAHARLYQRLRVAEEQQRTENTFLKKREKTRRSEGIIGSSPAMERVFDQLRRVVDTRVSVLIQGETGTGKELVAGALHYWSKRREHLFVTQNCAAVPGNLLESELFGHRKGAFTGATEDKKGLFELAHQGTLFLDEVGEMPLELQAKLLRVLQDGEVRPVGGREVRRVDVRIVAATNRDLEKAASEGAFREDLFYRLNVFPLWVPPLRHRRKDIPALAEHFLQRYCREFGKPVAGFSQQATEALCAYDWPGNVRELENEVQRIIIQVKEGAFVQPSDLSSRAQRAPSSSVAARPSKGTLKEMMDEVERGLLQEALQEHDNNKSATAKTLGITREGLHKKLKGHGAA